MSHSVQYNDMPTQGDVPVEPAIEDGRQLDQQGVNPADYAPPEPKAPEPKDPNELTIASADRLDQIYENARKQREIEDEPPAEQNEPPAEGQPQAASAHQEDQPRYRVVVDGREMEVSVEDLVRSYQIDQAAHRRMQEASHMRAQAQQFLELAQRGIAQPAPKDVATAQGVAPSPTNPAQSPTPPAGITEQDLMEAAEQIQLGTTEQGAKALEKLLSKAVPTPQQASAEPVDISRQVQSVIAGMRDTDTSTAAMTQFFNRYPSVAEDNIAHSALVAASKDEMMRDFAARGIPVDALLSVSPERLAETHRDMRMRGEPGFRQTWQILDAVARNDRFQHFATGPGARNLQVQVDRGERKAMVQQQPALRSATPPQPRQQQELSAEARNSSVVAEMRKSRGLSPAYG